MSVFFKALLGLASLLTILGLLLAVQDAGKTVSPEGCRMSWMSPSYVLQPGFDSTWSPLANRYSLWLYREVGWDAPEIGNSLPVLFIPGNAGSSRQVRSIASSAVRQFYKTPHHVSPDFASRTDFNRPLDVYSVEFNEDLSAFHGSTIESQIQYTTQAISYILSLYPPGTRITVLGHSMGGIVATSLLTSPNISAVITMATPYALPPARFDPSIDVIYSNVHRILAEVSTPIISVCGGTTDKMIPSESCILPATITGGLRRTMFSSALEGCWSGVGHETIVWCHQIRWRIARAVLELAPHKAGEEVDKILDWWLRNGHALPVGNSDPLHLPPGEAERAKEVSEGNKLVLTSPTATANGAYRLLVSRTASKATSPALTVLLSQGSINSLGPHRPIPLRLSIFGCDTDSNCSPLPPATLRLLPSPIPTADFPVFKEGVDESEAVVLFEAKLSAEIQSVILKVEDADGRGWLLGSIDQDDVAVEPIRMLPLIIRGLTVPIAHPKSFKNEFHFPSLLSHTLVAYRLIAVGSPAPQCSNVIYPPLIMHKSNPDETHYFTLRNKGQPKAVLHTHLPAPFIPTPHLSVEGVRITIYSSGFSDCDHPVEGLQLTIDWGATIARWASRYWMSVLSWAVGVVVLNIFCSMDPNGNITPVPVSLEHYTTKVLPRLSLFVFVLSFLPFDRTRYLGNGGEGWFSVIAPLILMISSGLVVLTWWLLSLLISLRKITSLLSARWNKPRADTSTVTKNTLASICLLLVAIFLFVPWQVAFLGCWVFHLRTCAASDKVPEVEATSRRSSDNHLANGHASKTPQDLKAARQNNINFNGHLLLLMTWLLPLVAPILAVWVRTLATAGLTSPFNGDHNFLNVAPFLILVDFTSRTSTRLFTPAPYEKWVSSRWLFAVVGIIAFVFGSRNPYVVFRAVALVVATLVGTKIGRRYWRG